MKALGPIDFTTKTTSFQWQNEQVSLQGIMDGQLEAISSSQLKRLHGPHAIYEFYHLQISTPSTSLDLDYSSLYLTVIPLINYSNFFSIKTLSSLQ